MTELSKFQLKNNKNETMSYIRMVSYKCVFFKFKGLSPDLQTMEQIRRIMRPTDVPDTGIYSKTENLYNI